MSQPVFEPQTINQETSWLFPRMKILFLALDVVVQGTTGDAIHVRELTNSLAQLGHDVALIAAPMDGKASEDASVFEGVDVTLLKDRGNVATVRKCGKILKDFRPDYIYERRFSPKIGAALSALHGVPLAVEINGLVEEELEKQGRTEDARRVLGGARVSLRKEFFAKAKKVIAVTQGIKDGLHDLYGIPLSKIVVVHNGANTDLFRSMDKVSCRERLDLEKDAIYLCFVGKLMQWFRLDQIIRILPELEMEIPGLRLVIVGDGPEKQNLEDLVRELGLGKKVTLTGYVPHDEVPIYINASDLCLAPIVPGSGYSPLKLFEYMACSRPVVGSRVIGFEVLERGAGMLYEPDDLKDLSSKIVKILSDEDMRISMGAVGRQLVEEEYSWRKVAERIVGVLEEAVS